MGVECQGTDGDEARCEKGRGARDVVGESGKVGFRGKLEGAQGGVDGERRILG